MENSTGFEVELENALNEKKEWFNTDLLQKMLSQYRLLHTCVKNLNEYFIKKSLIVPDPYRMDQRISEIKIPENSPFPETDISNTFGARFSDYETMLDYICTYFRFSVENITIVNIKKLLEFNKTFDWEELTINNTKMNTRALAITINSARSNANGVILNMISDSIEKSRSAINDINRMLNELAVFQKELYKGEIRKGLFSHPEFNKEKAMSSSENELAEIKRLYVKVIGKRAFYNDLINEIIMEDQAADKEERRAKVLKSLCVNSSPSGTVRKPVEVDSKILLMQTVFTFGALAPTLVQIHSKLLDNFNVIFAKRKNFFSLIGNFFNLIFKRKEKERICNVIIEDPKTGSKSTHKVRVNELIEEISQKERVYNGISMKGPEFSKLESSPEAVIESFVNKQISENQRLYTILNALDSYFKTNVDVAARSKIKGLQIELSAMRNSIISINKKRGEYSFVKEEVKQMKELGISENANKV